MPVKHGGSSGKAGDLRLGLLCSVALHVVAVVIAVVGLPQLLSPPPEISEPVIVEIAQLGDKTNPPPRQVEAPKPVEKPAEPPKRDVTPTPEPPKPEPPKPEPPKPEPPKPVPPPPPKPPEPEPEPIPVPTPKPKPPEPKPEPDVLKDIKPPPKKPPPPTKDDFDSLLKSVDKLRDTAKPAPAPQPQQTPAASSKTVNSTISDLNSQPTVSERDYVSAQIWPKWNVDLGAKGAETLQIRVRIQLSADGTVTSAKLDVDSARYAGDGFFRAAADAALRAVLAASPLKVPPTRPDLFKNNPDFTINFDPRSMVR
jgi:hypothetical protein